jgi:hypothetical protein
LPLAEMTRQTKTMPTMLSIKCNVIHFSTFTIPLITPMTMQITANTHKKFSVFVEIVYELNVLVSKA